MVGLGEWEDLGVAEGERGCTVKRVKSTPSNAKKVMP